MKYQRVYTAFWRETRAWPEDERHLAFYLLTCEHRRTEGLFALPLPYIAHDLAWAATRVRQALDGLIARGWAMHDGEWVLIVNALRHDQPNRGNQMKSAVTAVEAVPRSSPLYARFYEAAARHSGEFAEGLDRPSGGSTCAEVGGSGGFTPSDRDTDSNSNSDRDTNTLAAEQPVVVPPPPKVREEIDRACDTLAAAGMNVHDRRAVQVLADKHPTVDMAEAAINCARWLRAGDRRVRFPIRALEPFVIADDAPQTRHLKVAEYSEYGETTTGDAA